MHADIAQGASNRKCCTAEFIEVCVGLRAADTYANCIEAATPLPLEDFVVDLCERLCAVWRELDGADPRTRSKTSYLSCMDGLAFQTKHCTGPSPFAA